MGRTMLNDLIRSVPSVSTNGKVVIVEGWNGSTLVGLPDENGEGEVWSREIGYVSRVINKTCVVGRDWNVVTVEDYWMIVEEEGESIEEEVDNGGDEDDRKTIEIMYKVDGDGASEMNDESESGGKESEEDEERKEEKISVEKTELEAQLE